MTSHRIRLEENTGKIRGLYLINLCIAYYARTLSLLYCGLCVLLQDIRHKEVELGDRMSGEKTRSTNKAMITTN